MQQLDTITACLKPCSHPPTHTLTPTNLHTCRYARNFRTFSVECPDALAMLAHYTVRAVRAVMTWQ